jgi:cytochrome c-type protein NapC
MMSLEKYHARLGQAHRRWSTALLLFVAGIVFWGGFNWALEATNKESFCISCHEMEENVFKEYQNTVHYTNRTGVRATCPDCHVPKEWGPKMIRKIQASNEVLHKILGTIDTPEKFNAKRHEAGPARMGAHEGERLAGVPQLPPLRLHGLHRAG